MANKDIKYVGDSRTPAERVPNISPSYAEFPGKTEAFWPNFLLKEWMVASVCLVAFLILCVSHPSPLTDKADPTNTSFTPLPDWYFLFLFQLLKYPWASGDYVLLGNIVIPGLMFGGLLLAPFLDTGKERRPFRRPVGTGLMMLGIISIVYLTWAAMDEHHKKHPELAEKKHEKKKNKKEAAAGGKTDTADPGEAVYKKQASCIGCHGADLKGGGGPSLETVGAKLSEDDIKDVIKNGRGGMPKGMFQGSDADLDALSKWLATKK